MIKQTVMAVIMPLLFLTSCGTFFIKDTRAFPERYAASPTAPAARMVNDETGGTPPMGIPPAGTENPPPMDKLRAAAANAAEVKAKTAAETAVESAAWAWAATEAAEKEDLSAWAQAAGDAAAAAKEAANAAEAAAKAWAKVAAGAAVEAKAGAAADVNTENSYLRIRLEAAE